MELEQTGSRPAVALYVCAIGAGQELDKQHALVERHAAQRQWTVVKVYQDAGVSLFTPVGQRPAGSLLLEAATRGRFHKVLVPSLDSIVADTGEAARFHKQLAACGVSLHAVAT